MVHKPRHAGSLRILLAILLAILSCATPSLAETPQLPIIPKPYKVERTEGSFALAPKIFVVVASSQLKGIGQYLSDLLAPATGMRLVVRSSRPSHSQAIVLQLDKTRNDLGNEGYTLKSTPEEVLITAAKPAGVFYGVQTLRQLLPVEIENTHRIEAVDWRVPCGSVEDRPRFQWRGYLMDPARHFLGKQDLMRSIDLMALQKLNILQLHLSDDEGWRVAIRKYPKLTEVGARMPDYSGNKGEKWFYSQADIKELVAYAASRYVTIVPEIEMPGHSMAITTSYPQLSCDGKPATELCVVQENTFEFARNVLDEVMKLFPSPYIHIGADETNSKTWRSCPPCRRQMETLLKTPLPADVTAVRLNVVPYVSDPAHGAGMPFHEDIARLQGEFIRRVDQHLASKGRRMVGWDEILEDGLKNDSPAIVMAWRTQKAISVAAGVRRDGIVAMYPNFYLDNHTSLEATYNYESMPPGLTAEQEKHVLGVQGNLWGEVSTTRELRDQYSFPRLSAIAEIGWSSSENRNFEDFSARLMPFLRRLELMGIKPPPQHEQGSPAH
jgi:hexosaminidase